MCESSFYWMTMSDLEVFRSVRFKQEQHVMRSCNYWREFIKNQSNNAYFRIRAWQPDSPAPAAESNWRAQVDSGSNVQPALSLCSGKWCVPIISLFALSAITALRLSLTWLHRICNIAFCAAPFKSHFVNFPFLFYESCDDAGAHSRLLHLVMVMEL